LVGGGQVAATWPWPLLHRCGALLLAGLLAMLRGEESKAGRRRRRKARHRQGKRQGKRSCAKVGQTPKTGKRKAAVRD
jgi:hypothetical protein